MSDKEVKPAKQKSNYKEYSYEFPIFDALMGKQLGLQYADDTGFSAKAGVENTYNKFKANPMSSEDLKPQLSLAQRRGDYSVFGDVASMPGLDPTGRVGATYSPDPKTQLTAQLYNYDDTRDNIVDKGTLELRLKKELMDGLLLSGTAAQTKNGLSNYEVGLNYEHKF